MKDLGICADCGGKRFLIRAHTEDYLIVGPGEEIFDRGGEDGIDNEVRCSECDAFHTTVAQLGREWEGFLWDQFFGEE